MTTKPKARKAPAETGINPTLAALAAKLNAAHAQARLKELRQKGAYYSDESERAREKAYAGIWKLDKALARTAATNLEVLKREWPYRLGLRQANAGHER